MEDINSGVPVGEKQIDEAAAHVPESGEPKQDATQVSQEPQGESQGAAPAQSQYVPYSRFQEQNQKLRELNERYAQLQSHIEQMNRKPEPSQDDLKKTYEEEFYKDPIGTMMKIQQEGLGKITAEQTRAKQTEHIEGAKKWFRSQPGYTEDLEDKAAEFITAKGLSKLDPKVAVELAYEYLTKTEGSGYVRGVKEGLRKPGMGGAAPKFDLNTELAKIDPKLPPAEFEAKMREVWNKVNGGVK